MLPNDCDHPLDTTWLYWTTIEQQRDDEWAKRESLINTLLLEAQEELCAE